MIDHRIANKGCSVEEQTRSSSPGTPLTNFFKPASECERPTSSMQCSQGTLSTCPTARVSPYNPREPSSMISDGAIFKHFPYQSSTVKGGAECIDDLSDSVKVAFNVGGKEYWCTVATLRGGAGALFPEDEDCFFKRLLKRSWATNLQYQGEDGIVRCYIDRNGKCFPYILDYIRRGAITSTDDRGLLDMIAFEADFYGLHRLRTLAEARLADLEARDEKILTIGTKLGDVITRLVTMEQRIMMPSQIISTRQVPSRCGASVNARSSSSSSSHSSWSVTGGWRNTEEVQKDLGQGLYNGLCCGLLENAIKSPLGAIERSGDWLPTGFQNGSPLSADGRSTSSYDDRVLLINEDTEDPCGGASPDVLSKFYAEDRKFATDEDF